MAPALTSSEHAACVRRLAELRTIRDRDIPLLLREARQFVVSDADEEIVQLRDLLSFVTARIARLEHRLRTARIVAADERPVLTPLRGRSAASRPRGDDHDRWRRGGRRI